MMTHEYHCSYPPKLTWCMNTTDLNLQRNMNLLYSHMNIIGLNTTSCHDPWIKLSNMQWKLLLWPHKVEAGKTNKVFHISILILWTEVTCGNNLFNINWPLLYTILLYRDQRSRLKLQWVHWLSPHTTMLIHVYYCKCKCVASFPGSSPSLNVHASITLYLFHNVECTMKLCKLLGKHMLCNLQWLETLHW